MYEKRDKERNQGQIHMICIDDLVPKDNILRDIDAAIDFTFIYDEVEGMYSDYDGGRPGIDPVSLFKIVTIQYMFGIKSMRQTIKEIESNYAYRWFIGYDIGEEIPHFSTFGKNYSRRFKGTPIFENIFTRILNEAVDCGFVDERAVFIDGTHIKASANKKKSAKKTVPAKVKKYQKELDAEVEKDRIEHGKKPLKKNEEKTDKTVTESTTDPECGMYHKGEHERQFAYVANTACDKHNFILDFVIGAGNIHDSEMFDDVYDKVVKRFPNVEVVSADAAYKTPWIAKKIIDDGRIPAMPYKRPMTKAGFFKKYEYVYDEYYDCVICPEDKILKYSTTNRDGYREYKSDPRDCSNCPNRHKCTESKAAQKVVLFHVWDKYLEQVEDYRHMPEYRAIYEKRKETIERVFGDAKEKHGMRYTNYRGLAKVTAETALRFACMNLKKLAKWKKKNGLLRHYPHAYLKKIRENLTILIKMVTSGCARDHFVYGLTAAALPQPFYHISSFSFPFPLPFWF